MKKESNQIIVPDCKKFTGYKPCEPYKECPCNEPFPFGHRILIVNLDFVGDVLMTTAMLPGIKRKYPKSTVHWITRKNAMPVLENNPYLDRVWEWNPENRMILRSMFFDEILNADKNEDSCAFTTEMKAAEKLGFGINENGAIITMNEEAEYNYLMGLDDDLKFKKNRRTGLDILAETWRLDFRNDEYVLELTYEEKAFCRDFMSRLGISEKSFVIGFNTGCSNNYPNKRMTVEQHISLARMIKNQMPEAIILLLGGREDTERNDEIVNQLKEMVVATPTTHGLRNGLLYENCCNLVVTGDSLGMHIAIGLKKIVVVWFGLSCGVEVEIFGRGEKILSKLDCSPCWKHSCPEPLCLDKLDLNHITQIVARYYKESSGK